MKWLWFVGPLTVALVALLVSLVPTAEEKRLRAALQQWLDELIGPLRDRKKTRSRRVKRLSNTFQPMLDQIGDGMRLTDAVLVPKLAYVAARAAGIYSGSNHVTVLCRLKGRGPSFTSQPQPELDDGPTPKRGLYFKGDPEFNECFLVDGANHKAIGKWLKRSLRRALLELPDVWLRVQGDTMALTLYGTPSADEIDELVGVADAIYAERGASDDSLYGDLDDLGKATSKKRADVEASKAVPATPAAANVRLLAGAIDAAVFALGILFLAAILGAFAAFHPAELFNSPDLQVTEPWQGGWTTKGVGALIAAEAYVTCVIAVQAYLAIKHGQSIGKLLVGARIESTKEGGTLGFVNAVLLRQWVFALVPLIVAAATARPFGSRAFFNHIPTLPVIGAGVAVVALLIASAAMGGGQGLHDRLARTRVVRTEPWRLPALQLGVRDGDDPLVRTRVTVIGGIMLAFVALNAIAQVSKLGFWIY